MLANDPTYGQRQQEIEQFTNQYVAQHTGNEERAVVVIPVVFHVVYNTAAQNISTALINAQIAQLNLDYSRTNNDWTSTPSVFQSSVGNMDIQFCLATVDPTGAPTSGIERKSTTTASFGTNNDPIKFGTLSSTSGGLNAWPASQYLNIWVGNLSGGVLGYAQFPGGVASTDGVVLHFSTVGSVSSPNTAGAPYNLGRTATHEVGHWLNLRHIWGDANCGNDLVADTPTQQTSNFGCPAFPKVTCSNGPNGDMFMNYMDYTDDACMYMFTNGQVTRSQALFAAGGARVSLLSSTACGAPLACGTPSSLNATAITSTSATLGWSAVAGATSYSIQYTNPAGASTTVSSTTNSVGITGLTASTTYTYVVTATCSSGTGTPSASASFTTQAITACGTPTGLSSSAITQTTATLSWSAVSGANSYTIQYQASGGSIQSTTSATNTVNLTGLVANTSYSWQVSAACATGTSALSTASSFTTLPIASGCADVLEPNNSLSAAKPITVGTSFTAQIASSTDKDYYSFSNTSAARNIRIDLTTLPGDYDVRLYNPSGTLVASSVNGGTTDELIRYNNGAIGTYKIYVFGYNGAFSSTQCYTLLARISGTAWREAAEETPVTDSPAPSALSVVAAYPNPVNDMLNIQFNAPSNSNVTIQISDATGKLVRSEKFAATAGSNKLEIPMNDLSIGFYNLMITDNKQYTNVKVMKQ